MASIKRQLVPGHCDSCRTPIQSGEMPFVALLCHNHCVCLPCSKDYANITTLCPVCDKDGATGVGELRKGFVRPTVSKPASSRPSVEGKVLGKGSEKKSREGKVLAEPSIELSAMFCAPTPKQLRLEKSHKFVESFCCWPGTEVDQIVLGGRDTPVLQVAWPDGNWVEHRLNKGTEVRSGVTLNYIWSVLHVYPHQVYTVNLDPNSKVPLSLDPVHSLRVSDPIRVFQIDSSRFGVFGKANSGDSQVDIFKLEDLDSSDKPCKSVELGYRRPHQYDSICMNKDQQFCITSYEERRVYLYTMTGAKVRSFGEYGDVHQSKPGTFIRPMSIQCCADGALIVTNDWGDIHCLKDNKWSLIKDRDTNTLHCGMATQSKYWVIDGGSRYYVHVYTIIK